MYKSICMCVCAYACMSVCSYVCMCALQRNAIHGNAMRCDGCDANAKRVPKHEKILGQIFVFFNMAFGPEGCFPLHSQELARMEPARQRLARIALDPFGYDPLRV